MDSWAARAMSSVRRIVCHVTKKRETAILAFLVSNNSGVINAKILAAFQIVQALCFVRKTKDQLVSGVKPEVGDQRVKTRAMKDVMASAV